MGNQGLYKKYNQTKVIRDSRYYKSIHMIGDEDSQIGVVNNRILKQKDSIYNTVVGGQWGYLSKRGGGESIKVKGKMVKKNGKHCLELQRGQVGVN